MHIFVKNKKTKISIFFYKTIHAHTMHLHINLLNQIKHFAYLSEEMYSNTDHLTTNQLCFLQDKPIFNKFYLPALQCQTLLILQTLSLLILIITYCYFFVKSSSFNFFLQVYLIITE